MSGNLRVLVIGGGAGGFFGAIACAEAHPHAQVTLLEAGRAPLTKVRISGGGRCNVTHACFDPATLVQFYPRGGKALRGAFSRFQPKDTIAWFQRRGVTLKTEADGRMFPVTDDSATIVECLTKAAQSAGVRIKTNASVVAIQRVGTDFLVQLKSGDVIEGDRLLLATGSNAQGYEFARSLGHRIEPPVPSLFTFNIADPQLRELAGVAVESVRAQLLVPNQKPIEQSGALLITHWGMSGPAILRLSAWGARVLHDCRYQATLRVNWLPQLSFGQVEQVLNDAKTQEGRKAIASYSPVSLPRRLWQYLVARCQMNEEQRWADLSKKSLNQLVQALTQSQYAIAGKGAFKEEFVTCGGVVLKEVDFKTMESRLCPGLYFAGEILDIDGITGGFNFQSAWTTGWLAGHAMGEG
ncbi:NAD(P)/FAD-dependent oxidoreductase [Oscillatoria sp. FACHB-1407]|uniref:NAD(P)/FAD-dependent oxidoreductase n=1 Tax=Oscillatoria sp. FACHB-1407 TaxID=2692847 RepID=UPI001681ED71|nr:NAD(P)/FAD-dependent oxidoreductase [Oscillatoria sp. FACHB-1407]MBD2465331.1 NAD(P)/FAD-dependent oxidoreductase [Oscillatoria sp. FACHB-1407]